ncbi:MAG: dihydrofolate reductase family protein, partial [Chloroflexi bacterium]|nr:dihydrofolate reductase family protein [Chloroflexota bacterium]
MSGDERRRPAVGAHVKRWRTEQGLTLAAVAAESRFRRPHVLVNMAMTADGKVDTVERRGARISTEADLRRVDALRAEVDAVMVGGHTLLGEDPRLTVRSTELVDARRRWGRPPQPTRVGIVSAVPDPITGADLGPGSRFIHGERAPVIIFTTGLTAGPVQQRLAAAGASVLVMGERRVDLRAALGELARRGIGHVLVEGGGTLVAELLRLDLVDEVQLFVAPLVFGGRDAPTPVEGPGFGAGAVLPLRPTGVLDLGSEGIVLRYAAGASTPATGDIQPSPGSEEVSRDGPS